MGLISDARLFILPSLGLLKLFCFSERYTSHIVLPNCCMAIMYLLVCPGFLAADYIEWSLLISIIVCVCFLAISCSCAYLVNSYGALHNRMQANFGENRTTLSHMHEGLLILAKDKQK